MLTAKVPPPLSLSLSLPRPLQYLQSFVDKLNRLGPEGHRERTIDPQPLNAARERRTG